MRITERECKEMALRSVGTASTQPEKERIRAKLEADTQRFLECGGCIAEIENGHAAIKTQLVHNRRSNTLAAGTRTEGNPFQKYVDRRKL